MKMPNSDLCPVTGYFAHSENGVGVKHELVQHLKEVAQLAGEFAAKFGAPDCGYYAGLWHDLGKFHPDFQSYIASPPGRRGPDHSSAGAAHAMACFEPLTFPVAGHHAGLPNRADLKGRLREKSSSPQVVEGLRGSGGDSTRIQRGRRAGQSAMRRASSWSTAIGMKTSPAFSSKPSAPASER